MKQCPKCKSTYADESLQFCVSDGAALGPIPKQHDPEAETLLQRDADSEKPSVFTHHIKKVVKLGSYCDIEFRLRTIRISVKDITRGQVKDRTWGLTSKEEDLILLYVNTGGGLVYGGPRTTEVAPNEYLVPVHTFEEEINSIYSFKFNDNRVSFFRVYVEHVDTHQKQVELNIVILTS